MLYCLYHRGEACAIVSATNRRAAERGAGEVLYGTPKFPCQAKPRTQCGQEWQDLIDAHCDRLSAEVDEFFANLLGEK